MQLEIVRDLWQYVMNVQISVSDVLGRSPIFSHARVMKTKMSRTNAQTAKLVHSWAEYETPSGVSGALSKLEFREEKTKNWIY